VEIPVDDPAFIERFARFVDPATGEWTGYRDRDGYGVFTVAGKNGQRVKFRAHRVAWAIANRRQPAGVIRHTCDDPPCCRADHLLDGTQADNIADRDDPVRRSARRHRKLAAHGQLHLPVEVPA
jgi:hypothetical protein